MTNILPNEYFFSSNECSSYNLVTKTQFWKKKTQKKTKTHAHTYLQLVAGRAISFLAKKFSRRHFQQDFSSHYFGSFFLNVFTHTIFFV